jgi:hypothetical protein
MEQDDGMSESDLENCLELSFSHGGETATVLLSCHSGEWAKKMLDNLLGGSQMSWSVYINEPDAPWSYTITLAQDPTLQ